MFLFPLNKTDYSACVDWLHLVCHFNLNVRKCLTFYISSTHAKPEENLFCCAVRADAKHMLLYSCFILCEKAVFT